MSTRTVTDASGRMWLCAPENEDNRGSSLGQDVTIVCKTATVSDVVRLTVGYRWLRMADEGLARLITSASQGAPPPA